LRRTFFARLGSLTSVARAIPPPAVGLRLRSPEIGEKKFSRYVGIATRKTERAGCTARVGVSRAGRPSSQNLPRHDSEGTSFSANHAGNRLLINAESIADVPPK
jgi:hypothetical protein